MSVQTLIEAICSSVEAAQRSGEGAAPPVAILWTDADGQWRPLLPALCSALPHI